MGWSITAAVIPCCLILGCTPPQALELEARSPELSDRVREPTAASDPPMLLQAGNDIFSFRLGDQPVNLTHSPAIETSASWHPAKDQVVMSRSTEKSSDLYVLRPGGSPTRLFASAAQETEPDWSPDGKSILFSSDRDGDWDIYVYRLKSKRIVTLLNTPADEFGGAWSPRGDKIAFHVGNKSEDVWVMGNDGEEARRLTRLGFGNRARAAGWLDSGRLIVEFIGGTVGCRVLRLDGHLGRRIGQSGDMRCTPSPDGHSLAVQKIIRGQTSGLHVVDIGEQKRSGPLAWGTPVDW